MGGKRGNGDRGEEKKSVAGVEKEKNEKKKIEKKKVQTQNPGPF